MRLLCNRTIIIVGPLYCLWRCFFMLPVFLKRYSTLVCFTFLYPNCMSMLLNVLKMVKPNNGTIDYFVVLPIPFAMISKCMWLRIGLFGVYQIIVIVENVFLLTFRCLHDSFYHKNTVVQMGRLIFIPRVPFCQFLESSASADSVKFHK